MTSVIGTSVIGAGGDGAKTVNGIAPDGLGNISLTATDIPSTDGSVQEDIDGLQPITTEAELAARFTLIGSVYQIDGPLKLGPSGLPDLAASGNTLLAIPPYAGISGCAGCTIIGNSASALVAGPMNMQNVALWNQGAGPDFDLSGTTDSLLSVVGVSCLGQTAGRFANVLGSAIIDGVIHRPLAPNASGFEFDATVNGPFLATIGGFSPGGTDYTAISIQPTETIGALRFQTGVLAGVNAGDAYLDIDPAFTIGATSVISVIGNEIVDGVGSLFAVGSADQTDPRILSAGNTNGPSSNYRGDPSFEGAGVPILLVHAPGIDVLPSENAGPTATLSAGPTDERMDLVINALQDWYLELVGRIDSITGRVLLTATVARSGGNARPFELVAQIDVGGAGTWVDIPGASATLELGTTPATVVGEAPLTLNVGDRLRLRGESTDATTTAISSYSLGFTGKP